MQRGPSDEVLWSVEAFGDGNVCVCIGLGAMEFEVWLSRSEAELLGAELLKLGAESKPRGDA